MPRRAATGTGQCCGGASTTGVPWVWNVSIVFMPQAWPFLRSSSLHSTTGWSGSSSRRAPALRELDAVAARLPDVQEERLVDRVLVRARLDVDAVLEEDVGGLEDVLAGVGGEGDVVQAVAVLGPVVGVDDVVGLQAEVEPPRGEPPVVEPDALALAAAERLRDEPAVRLDVLREEVDVVEPAGVDAAAGEGGCLVLQRRLVVGRDVALGLVVDAPSSARRGRGTCRSGPVPTSPSTQPSPSPVASIAATRRSSASGDRRPQRRAADARGIRCA